MLEWAKEVYNKVETSFMVNGMGSNHSFIIISTLDFIKWLSKNISKSFTNSICRRGHNWQQ